MGFAVETFVDVDVDVVDDDDDGSCVGSKDVWQKIQKFCWEEFGFDLFS